MVWLFFKIIFDLYCIPWHKYTKLFHLKTLLCSKLMIPWAEESIILKVHVEISPANYNSMLYWLLNDSPTLHKRRLKFSSDLYPFNCLNTSELEFFKNNTSIMYWFRWKLIQFRICEQFKIKLQHWIKLWYGVLHAI